MWRLRNKTALQVQELIESHHVGNIMKVTTGEIKDMLWGPETINRGWGIIPDVRDQALRGPLHGREPGGRGGTEDEGDRLDRTDMDQTPTEEDNNTYAARGPKTRACQVRGILIWVRFAGYAQKWDLVALGHETLESL